jgi:hypothetical protein
MSCIFVQCPTDKKETGIDVIKAYVSVRIGQNRLGNKRRLQQNVCDPCTICVYLHHEYNLSTYAYGVGMAQSE